MKTFKVLFVLVYFVILSVTMPAQTFKSEKGTIEIVGLFSQEGKKILDDMAGKIKSGNTSFCAADLKIEYKVPDAAVHMFFYNADLSNSYTLIKFVDPVNRDKIKYEPDIADKKPYDERFGKILSLIRDDNLDFTSFAKVLGLDSGSEFEAVSVNLQYMLSKENINNAYNAVRALNTEDDFKHALWIIDNDGNYLNRVAAVMVLSNFYGNGMTLNYILKCIRTNDARVAGTASALVQSFPKSKLEKMDWEKAVTELRYIVDGTNLFGFDSIISVIIKAKLPASFAVPLLKDGGEMITDNLGISQNEKREASHKLLVQLSGKDFGYDAVKWREWINSL